MEIDFEVVWMEGFLRLAHLLASAMFRLLYEASVRFCLDKLQLFTITIPRQTPPYISYTIPLDSSIKRDSKDVHPGLNMVEDQVKK